jgi:hypothetical protein
MQMWRMIRGVELSRLAAAPEIATVEASCPVQPRAIALNETATCERID